MAVPTPPTGEVKHPVQLSVPYPESSSRWLALATLLGFVKPLLLIPHLIVIYILAFCAFIGAVVGQIAVLFTGRYPRPMFALVKGVFNWQARVNTYFFGLTDAYPPFAFQTDDAAEAKKGLMWVLIPGLILLALFIFAMVKGGNGPRSGGYYGDRDLERVMQQYQQTYPSDSGATYDPGYDYAR